MQRGRTEFLVIATATILGLSLPYGVLRLKAHQTPFSDLSVSMPSSVWLNLSQTAQLMRTSDGSRDLIFIGSDRCGTCKKFYAMIANRKVKLHDVRSIKFLPYLLDHPAISGSLSSLSQAFPGIEGPSKWTSNKIKSLQKSESDLKIVIVPYLVARRSNGQIFLVSDLGSILDTSN